MLFVPLFYYPFLSIRLFGEMISATIFDGVRLLIDEGFAFVGLLVFGCSLLLPFLHSLCVLMANIGLKTHNLTLMRWSTYGADHLRQWMMLDVYIISIAICCFKLYDYSDLHFGAALPMLLLLQVVCLSLVIRVSPVRYWQQFDRQANIKRQQTLDDHQNGLHDCPHCHLAQAISSQCERCHTPIRRSRAHSLQATWALLIVAMVALIPANWLPISILFTNGNRQEDTIFSGVISLVENDMPGIAVIIFVASIVVPVAKILGMLLLLTCIHIKRTVYQKQRMMLFYIVKWIGKWSMVDLFVMAIMLTLVDRGHVLNFTPGLGATAFGIVVVFTMLAAESLDPRLIWNPVNSDLS